LSRLAIAILAGVLMSVATQPSPLHAKDAAKPTPASSALATLLRDYETFDRAENPIASSFEGDTAALSKLSGVTPADDARRKKALEQFRARLIALPAKDMNDADRLNAAFLKRVIDVAIEAHAFDASRLGFTNEGGPEMLMGYLEYATVIRTLADAEAFIARFEASAKTIEDTTANVRRGVKTGFVQSRATAAAALTQLRAALEGAKKLELPVPLKSLPDAISPADQERLRAKAKDILAKKIVPAQEAFLKTVETEVMPVAKPAIGAMHLPDGKAYYAYLARFYTTTALTPDEIHDIGQKEVARIRAEMEKEKAAAGFNGSLSEFLKFLRTDPRFYATSRESLMEKSAYIAKRADDALPRLFATLPRLPYGVREVPRNIEENYTTGRYNPGSPALGLAGGLMVNTSHLDQRPLYEHPALMLHEGVPGHHLQIAITQELGDLPWFRRQAEVTAYVEGWGLYSEFLGTEMGMYRDAYERFGKLSMEMWRACRLVVDTGIHWKGWTLEQARTCFTENSALATKNIENELQRYIAGPGQALAYKIGELKIRELRKTAERELGAKFDVRRFHDALLWGGPLPLDLLQQEIGKWIAAEKQRNNK
jgi:uncharacterized protein (DUF885 family)